FGCVLYEMLTGRRAFGGDTASDIVAAILEREPDWTATPVAASSSLQALLARCLCKDPKRRLRDIGDARLDLDRDDAPPVSSDTRAAPRSKRVVWWAVDVALIVAIAAVAAMMTRRWSREPDIQFETAIPSDFHPNFPQIALSPDGRQLVVAPT